MPELPDLEVFSKNLQKKFAHHKIVHIKVNDSKALPDSESGLNKALKGKTLEKVYRSGKELRFRFSDDTLLGMHLMLNGNLAIFEKQNSSKHTIVEMQFDNDTGLALIDWQSYATIKLNPTDKGGIDALSEELNFTSLKEILQSKKNIKTLLMDQNIIRGIGNAYADEILWEARISPFSIARAIPDDKIKKLAKAIKTILENAVKQILKKEPDLVSGEVRDFLKIHHTKNTSSPEGAPIEIAKIGGRSTYYTNEQELYTT